MQREQRVIRLPAAFAAGGRDNPYVLYIISSPPTATHVRGLLWAGSMLEYGPGPWFVALLQESSLQLSEIIIHTYPELIAEAINYKNRYQTRWNVAQIVGPFTSLQHGQSYKTSWDRSKQLKTRLENGRKLYVKSKAIAPVFHMWSGGTNTDVPTGVPVTIVGPEPFASVADFVDLHRKRVK
jgi:hypothetical protein